MKTNKRKNRILTLFSCMLLLLTGCSAAPQTATDGLDWQDDWTTLGRIMGVDAPQELTLLDNKEALAADGLYYATWVAGSSVPYENSEGDTVDLYDAQLYLLASEATDEKAAEKSCGTWLSSAEDNYDIQSKDTITCNGQSYTLISYNCISEDSPYDRGVSALGVCGTGAVCAELTCVKGYSGDLTQLLMEFLNNCHYNADIAAQ